jgi:hypothetical protein
MKEQLRFALILADIYDFVPMSEDLDMDDLTDAYEGNLPSQDIINSVVETYHGWSYSDITSLISQEYFKN